MCREESSVQAQTIEKSFAQAVAYYENNQLEKAQLVLQEVRLIAPNMPEILHLLALISLRSDNPEEAVEHLKRAVQVAPKSAELFNILGSALKKCGCESEAVSAQKQAVALDPKHADAHYNLALSLKSLRRFEEAIDHILCAIENGRDGMEAHLEYGTILIRTGELDQAKNIARQVLERNSQSTEAIRMLGVIAGLQGELETAIQYLLQVVECEPGDIQAYQLLGKALKALEYSSPNGLNEIRTRLTRLAEATPKSSEPRFLAYWLDQFTSPSRSDSYKKAMESLPHLERETIRFESPATQSVTTNQKPTRIVALLQWARSGTGFLHSLMDGHPQVSTLPGSYLSGFFGRELRLALATVNRNELVESFIKLHDVLFDAASGKPLLGADHRGSTEIGVDEGYTVMGRERNQVLSLDRKKFADNLNALFSEYTAVELSDFFRLVHVAFEQTLGRHSNKELIFYHIHNPDNYELTNFLRHNPQSKLLMTVREPLQSCESWLTAIPEGKKSYEEVVDRLIESLFKFDQIVFRLHDSRGVRLEDLKNPSSGARSALCQWMGIDDDETLGTSTFQGLRWWGDPTTIRFGRTEPVMGFETDEFDPATDPIKRKVGYLFSNRDQLILRTLFYPVRVLYGYADKDDAGFRNDLAAIEPILGKPFDFEVRIKDKFQPGRRESNNHVAFTLLRSVLRDRWEALNNYGTYANMVPPLEL